MNNIDEIEKCISEAVRLRRIKMKMTQVEVAKELGISFQQIQKYENGINRITVGRLFMLSLVLKVDVKTFFSNALENLTRTD